MGRKSTRQHAKPPNSSTHTAAHHTRTGPHHETSAEGGSLSPLALQQAWQSGSLQRRSQAVMDMQQRYGNAHVGRMLANPHGQAVSNVQRITPISGNVSTGTKHTFKTPKKEWRINRPIPRVPLSLASISTLAEISFETESNTPSQGSPTAGRGGVAVNPGGIGVQGEIGHKWAEWETGHVGRVSVGTKLGAEIGSHGGEISLEAIGLEFERASFALKFNLISYSTEESRVEFPSLVFQAGVVPFKGETRGPDGRIHKYEIKPVLEFKFEPNYAEIGRWLAQRYGQMAAGELALAAGFVLGGFATIAAGIVTAGLGEEVYGRVEQAIRNTNEFCSAYEATIRSGQTSGGSSQWATAGSTAGMRFLEQSRSRVPVEAMQAAAQRHGIRGEAFALAFPQVREAMLKNYREQHYVEWWFYGEDGPGYKVLRSLLYDPARLNF